MRIRKYLLLCALLSATALLADSWPGPQVREVFSASRSYFVRVTPGNSWGDTVGFAGSPKGPFAKALFYRLAPDKSYKPVAEIDLVNPVAPVDFFVNNAGYLATLDNWHNRGYGKVAVFYSPEGKLLKSYALAELFSADEIEKFQHTVSSITWHDMNYVRLDQKTLWVSTEQLGAGSSFIFDMQTGAYRFCHWHDKPNVNYRCRNTNTDRKWEPFDEK